MLDLVIVGAGTSGLMCGCLCVEEKLNVILLEKENTAGLKLKSSGNGRCNVTNSAKQSELLKAFYGNSKFMFSPLAQFSNIDIINFFESRNIPLKQEAHGRIFPASDKALDIVNLFISTIGDALHTNEKVSKIEKIKDHFLVTTNKKTYNTKAVLLSTGAKTYPELGGSSLGYDLATQLGHTITPTFSVCCPFVFETPISELMGTTLENVNVMLPLKKKHKCISTQNILFTHYGITGPAIFEASYEIQMQLQKQQSTTILIGCNITSNELLHLLQMHPKKHFTNTLSLFTNRYLKWLSTQLDFDNLTNEQLMPLQIEALHTALTGFPFEIKKAYDPIHAFVTAGGVSLAQVSPSTMMSKLCDNLYFAGELLDLQAYTGGYNITIAFSTAFQVFNHILTQKDL